MKSNSLYAFILGAFLVASCHYNNNYYEHTTLIENQWKKDSAVVFTIPVQEKGGAFDIFMVLRNNNDYPYSNIYFFTELTSPKGKKMIDTLEYQLAYPSGEWIGSGMGGIKQNTLVYKENFMLKDTGTYQIKIKQAMRDNPLKGIEDMGLIVEKRN